MASSVKVRRRSLRLSNEHDSSRPILFPNEILEEIFLRVPKRNLLKMELVSKSWNNIINNPNFWNLYAQRHSITFPKSVLKRLDGDVKRTKLAKKIVMGELFDHNLLRNCCGEMQEQSEVDWENDELTFAMRSGWKILSGDQGQFQWKIRTDHSGLWNEKRFQRIPYAHEQEESVHVDHNENNNNNKSTTPKDLHLRRYLIASEMSNSKCLVLDLKKSGISDISKLTPLKFVHKVCLMKVNNSRPTYDFSLFKGQLTADNELFASRLTTDAEISWEWKEFYMETNSFSNLPNKVTFYHGGMDVAIGGTCLQISTD